MTYRSDLDALAARHATLEAELGRRRRELAEVTGMLAEARQMEQAEQAFAGGMPDLRRRPQRHLFAIALAVTLGTGASVGVAAADEVGSRREVVGAAKEGAGRVRMPRVMTAEDMLRMEAELEALRAIGLVAVVAPNYPAGGRVVVRGVQRAEREPKAERPTVAWTLGTNVPVRGSLWGRSAAGEDQR